MIRVLACGVCDSAIRHDLVSFYQDPYLKSLPGRTDHTVRYMICDECGFVFQDPMMDASEMERLYATEYRPSSPPPRYLGDVRCIAMDVYAWIAERTGLRGEGRSVLDIGCAAGLSLRPFALQGWRAVGLDPGSNWIEYGRREFGLDLRSEFFTKDSFPGEQFDLILFSHVIEHVQAPAPVLAAIREKLSDDGYVFIGTPNVLAPKRKLYPGLFGGDHVRLFSPRTIRAYLRRHGLRPVVVETHQPRGLRVLAVKADPYDPPDRNDRDDWQTVCSLYNGLLAPDRGAWFEWNLAALVERQEAAIEEVCRKDTRGLYRVGFEAGEADNVEVKRADGTAAWLYGSIGSRSNAVKRCSGSLAKSRTIVCLGLGLGHLAQRVLQTLNDDQRLIIWEGDAALFRTTIRIRDLSDLFRSPNVTLLVGPEVESLQRLIGQDRAGTLMSLIADAETVSPDSAPLHGLYREFEFQLRRRAERARRSRAVGQTTMAMPVAG